VNILAVKLQVLQMGSKIINGDFVGNGSNDFDEISVICG
jgi:hypothetical protein